VPGSVAGPGSRRALLLIAAAGSAFGCHSTSAPGTANRSYLHDPSFRRAELLASLVNPDNDYSRLRIARYAIDGGWDSLPEWNPPVQILGGSGSNPGPPERLSWSADIERDPAALRALGEQAFYRYPAQLTGFTERMLARGANLEDYGFWRDADAGIGGLVEATLPSGRGGLAFTCASCHATVRDGRLVTGLGNERLDLGRIATDDARPDPLSAKAKAVAAWGPGRLDVSTTDGTEPVRFPDLRGTRFQSHLQADATVAQRDLVALAIRIETLIVTSNDEVVRPPREVTLALAAYVWSLGEGLPAASPHSAGAAVFERTCAGCHRPPEYSGQPVPLEVVGTDPTVGRSRDRGTGTYEVPSLRGVALRGRLLHDGAFASLDALLDPGRIDDRLGHHFGLRLPDGDRQALLEFVRGL
jgi:hypothetical protein